MTQKRMILYKRRTQKGAILESGIKLQVRPMVKKRVILENRLKLVVRSMMTK